ncbi:MAG: hypothetical protein Q9201_003524 [Fulgogasparrea decipioides]
MSTGSTVKSELWPGLHKSASPRIAAPAPSPGASCWVLAPPVGAAAGEVVGVDPIIEPAPSSSACNSTGIDRRSEGSKAPQYIPPVAAAVLEPITEELVLDEDPVCFEDPPVLVEDPPVLAPVAVASPGHVASVGKVTLALDSNIVSMALDANKNACLREARTYHISAERLESFLASLS